MTQERCIKTVYSEISARRSPFVCQVSDIRGTCQARRKTEREGERYIGRDPIHVPSIHPSRQATLVLARQSEGRYCVFHAVRAGVCWHKIHGICAWLLTNKLVNEEGHSNPRIHGKHTFFKIT